MYINVNHQDIENAAKNLDSTVNEMRDAIGRMDSKVGTMDHANIWSGTDYYLFRDRWAKTTDGDSSTQKILDGLTAYAEFLHYASAKYKEAQSNAVNFSAFRTL
jgi:uncharacterized protein YukE